MAWEAGALGEQLCSVKRVEGAAAQTVLLWVDFPVTCTIKTTKSVYLTENVSVLFVSDTEAEITLHFT